MDIVLEGGGLRAVISDRGAELRSLVDSTGTELLWQGDEAYWTDRSPLLFPIVGRLKDGYYKHNGMMYSLPTHGFARTSTFEVVKQQSDRVRLRLTHTPETLKQYPFKFSFEVLYTLESGSLTIGCLVANQGDKPMPFSFGLHPGFAHSWCDDDCMENYQVRFSSEETAENIKVDGGLLSTESDPFLTNQRDIELTDAHFEVDAIVLKGIRSNLVTLQHLKSSRKLTMDIGDFPDFALWSRPGAGYVCLEPWHGHGDRTDHNHSIWDKEGIISLAPSQNRVFRSSITIDA